MKKSVIFAYLASFTVVISISKVKVLQRIVFGNTHFICNHRFLVQAQPCLTHEMPAVLLSYRNQSIDLLRKSIDWFPYEGNTGI